MYRISKLICLQEEELRDTILVVFANKQDQPRALNAEQVSEGLGLTEIRSRQWSIHETSAVQGKGLFEVRFLQCCTILAKLLSWV